MNEILQVVPESSNETSFEGLHVDSHQPDLLLGRLQVLIPLITYDNRGRIMWKTGNNPEKDLQIGTANIQAIFLRKFPEFLEFLLEEPEGRIQVNGDKKKEASQFISERIGSKEDFISVFGYVPRSKSSVPYFKGSYQFIINESFSPWGITLDYKIKPDGYWANPRNVRSELQQVIDKTGHFPSRQEFSEMELSSLYSALSKTEGIGFWRLQMGEEIKRRNREYWQDESNLRTELGAVIRDNNLLVFPNHQVLKTLGYTSLSRAITRMGGLRRWREEFQAEITAVEIRRPANYFSDPSNILTEARKFLEREGSLSFLRAKDPSLIQAIYKNFPGGYREIRRKLSLTQVRWSNYWDIDQIEKEAREFYEKFGQLTGPELRLRERKDLFNAINRLYPGKFSAIREKLGILEKDPAVQMLEDYEAVLQSGEATSFREFVRRKA